MKRLSIKKLLKSNAAFLRELYCHSRPYDSYSPARAKEIVEFALNIKTREKTKAGKN